MDPKLENALIELGRAEMRAALERFSQTPLGTLVKTVGTKILSVKNEGRDLSRDEIVELCETISKELGGDGGDKGDGK